MHTGKIIRLALHSTEHLTAANYTISYILNGIRHPISGTPYNLVISHNFKGIHNITENTNVLTKYIRPGIAEILSI